ncbi:hypothetical protein B0T21DRAFT_353375 [Apiosordaria backusii]|uniref:Uncharacterized protein n=1 Tax=Apiosordaria backusii TaxID=314023 RepID=A0AA40DK89_9PEZI|nr:hypothetical protein B0T21DRAFT_353375 [Apiosordaria backusii]
MSAVIHAPTATNGHSVFGRASGSGGSPDVRRHHQTISGGHQVQTRRRDATYADMCTLTVQFVAKISRRYGRDVAIKSPFTRGWSGQNNKPGKIVLTMCCPELDNRTAYFKETGIHALHNYGNHKSDVLMDNSSLAAASDGVGLIIRVTLRVGISRGLCPLLATFTQDFAICSSATIGQFPTPREIYLPDALVSARPIPSSMGISRVGQGFLLEAHLLLPFYDEKPPITKENSHNGRPGLHNLKGRLLKGMNEVAHQVTEQRSEREIRVKHGRHPTRRYLRRVEEGLPIPDYTGH